MKTNGFTLIEAMVAVTIVTISIAGPLIVANSAIVAARTARDQLIASYLAQEGIEYMRAVRDDQYLAAYPNNTNSAWDNFLNASAITSCRANACILGGMQAGGTLCQGSGCTSPFSLMTGGMLFTRTIQVNNVPNTDNDKQIVSTVSWSFHSSQYSVIIYDHLTPWQ